MAQFLVRAFSTTHQDQDLDARRCYKKGDIVTTEEDDHIWGRLEGPPEFVIISVALPIQAAEALTGAKGKFRLPYYLGELPEHEGGGPKIERRRQYAFEEQVVDQALANSGKLQLTQAQFVQSLIDKAS